ncbi:MAG TPA: hypothetical protein VFO20_00900, partial [Propionibacteriaceae bacterium]|nr:hypothetical protein [Propionibacteriaceae bacterium]
HRDIEDAMNLVYDRKLDAHRLISKIYPLEEAVNAIDSLRSGEEMKVLIKPGRAQSMLQP